MSTIRLITPVLLILVVLAGTPSRAAEPQMPMQLHTVLRSETQHCMVGDFLQVRYKTRSTENGISTLQVQGGGTVLRQAALVTAPVDPTDESSQPGQWYFVIVMFKVVKPGETTVKITPVYNDGSTQKPFQFGVEAQQ